MYNMSIKGRGGNMTLAQKSKQINHAFIQKYLPLDTVVENCGNELLFRDENNNLIYVRVSYISKDREAQLIKYTHDKRIALEEKDFTREI